MFSFEEMPKQMGSGSYNLNLNYINCESNRSVICRSTGCRGSTGVDFKKVGRTAQIIEIALLKLCARRKARSMPLKSFSKVGRRVQNSL